MVRNESSLPRGKLSANEAGLLLEQLSSGVEHQQPLDEVFRALADDLEDSRLQKVAVHLADQLEAGVSLETATESMTDILPEHLRGALAIGVKTGNLSGVLTGLAESELARKRMRRGLRTALAYPVFVLVFLLGILLFLSLAVVPYLAEIYDSFEMNLPVLTIYTIQIADALPKVMLVVGGLAVAVLLFGFFLTQKRFLHWIRTALPLLGRTWIWSSQHEFATLMSTLTKQQVPINEALACTIGSLRDRHLAWAAARVNERCADGASLSQSLRESLHFAPTLTTLAEWGEENEAFPLAMRQAADTYEQQMQLFTQFLHRVLPPLMLTFVATTLFFLIASLIIPLISFNEWLY